MKSEHDFTSNHIFGTIAHHLIAGRPNGVLRIAITGLTATTTRHVPRVGCTAVTVLTNHVWEAVTLATGTVAVTVARCWTGGRLAAQRVAHTFWPINRLQSEFYFKSFRE